MRVQSDSGCAFETNTGCWPKRDGGDLFGRTDSARTSAAIERAPLGWRGKSDRGVVAREPVAVRTARH